MRVVELDGALKCSSRLIEQAAKGEALAITKAGKALVSVKPFDAGEGASSRRLGFLEGEYSVPDNFDTMGGEQIDRRFGARD